MEFALCRFIISLALRAMKICSVFIRQKHEDNVSKIISTHNINVHKLISYNVLSYSVRDISLCNSKETKQVKNCSA